MDLTQGNIEKPGGKYHCLALFSGGLDSILAVKIIQSQGLKVLGVHFFSPFFGHPEKIEHWERQYNVDIIALDVGEDFLEIIKRPRWGHGKGLNPCVDCKVFMLKQTKELLPLFSASFIITGEVVGQRPMSQRRDPMEIIMRYSNTSDILLRPLTAKNLPPSRPEREGMVHRELLLDIRGRGRKRQLALARRYNIHPIPTPAGGCLLTDPQYVQRFTPLLTRLKKPSLLDFSLAKVGRQLWHKDHWLIIGRHHQDNQRLLGLREKGDLLFKLKDIPGPLGIGRQKGKKWPPPLIEEAAYLMARYSRARASMSPITVTAGDEDRIMDITVIPGAERPISWEGPL